MLSFFKTKTDKERLESKYQKLMDRVYTIQEVNPAEAQQITLKAQQVMQQIVLMEREERFGLS